MFMPSRTSDIPMNLLFTVCLLFAPFLHTNITWLDALMSYVKCYEWPIISFKFYLYQRHRESMILHDSDCVLAPRLIQLRTDANVDNVFLFKHFIMGFILALQSGSITFRSASDLRLFPLRRPLDIWIGSTGKVVTKET